MSTVVKRLTNFIRTKSKGEEVRGSIADGLDAMDDRLDESINNQLITVDPTLTITGAGADAKVVGDLFKRTRLTGKSYTYGESADNLIDDGVYFCSTTNEYPNGTITDLPYSTSVIGWLEVTKNTSGNAILQVFYPYSNDRKPKRRYRGIDQVWRDWSDFYKLSTDTTLSISNTAADAKVVGDLFKRTRLTGKSYTYGESADNLIDDGVYFCSTTNEYPNGTITDLPYSTSVIGWLEVTKNTSGNAILQVFYPYSNDRKPKRRYRGIDQVWRDWDDFGQSTTNNYDYNIYQNTYNVTATPTITSGLPYVLTSSGDSTDRTLDIQTILSQNGFCMLGPGTFYVSNLSVGPNQSLMGSGIGNTVIRMIDNVTGSAISLGTRSSISDLTLFGGENSRPSSNGGRNAVAWQGTFISQENPGSYPYRGQINNIFIYGFNGAGIICSNTSMNVATGLNVVNVNIMRCWCGIYIPIFSEYHRFSNIEIDGCYYGVINNGGNNMFSNCGFNTNQIGFYIDNSNDQSPNNSHGSAVCCTFNHSGGNSGTAIKLDGVDAGYVFSACQFFYGELDIKNSEGILFDACNIGAQVPIAIDSGMTVFNACLFRYSPSVTKTNNPIVKTTACYLRDTGTDIII